MRKAKRSFINTPKANKWDLTHNGFAVVHEERMIYVFESTDAEIRRGNDELQEKVLELVKRFPHYSWSVLHIYFAI